MAEGDTTHINELGIFSLVSHINTWSRKKKWGALPNMTKSVPIATWRALHDWQRDKSKIPADHIASFIYSVDDFINYAVMCKIRGDLWNVKDIPSTAEPVTLAISSLTDSRVELDKKAFQQMHLDVKDKIPRLKNHAMPDGYFVATHDSPSYLYLLWENGVIGHRFYLSAMHKVRDTEILEKCPFREKRFRAMLRLLRVPENNHGLA
jgi:hypothetical protein